MFVLSEAPQVIFKYVLILCAHVSSSFRSGLSLHLLQSGGGRPAGLLLRPDPVWFPAGSGLPQICRRDRKRAQPPSGPCWLPPLWPGGQTLPEERRRTHQRLDVHGVSVVPGQRGWQSSSAAAASQPPGLSPLRGALSVPRDPPQCPPAVCRSQSPTSSTAAQPQSGADSPGDQPAAAAGTNHAAPERRPPAARRPSQTARTFSVHSACAELLDQTQSSDLWAQHASCRYHSDPTQPAADG